MKFTARYRNVHSTVNTLVEPAPMPLFAYRRSTIRTGIVPSSARTVSLSLGRHARTGASRTSLIRCSACGRTTPVDARRSGLHPTQTVPCRSGRISNAAGARSRRRSDQPIHAGHTAWQNVSRAPPDRGRRSRAMSGSGFAMDPSCAVRLNRSQASRHGPPFMTRLVGAGEW